MCSLLPQADDINMLQTTGAQAAVSVLAAPPNTDCTLSMRWYLAEAPSQSQPRIHNPQGLHARRSGSHDSAAPLLHIDQEACSQHSVQHNMYEHAQKKLTGPHGSGSSGEKPHATDVSLSWSKGTRVRIAVSCMLLCVYFILVGMGC